MQFTDTFICFLILIFSLIDESQSCQACFHPRVFRPLGAEGHSHEIILANSSRSSGSRQAIMKGFAIAIARQRLVLKFDSRYMVSQGLRSCKDHLRHPASRSNFLLTLTTMVVAMGGITVARRIMVQNAPLQERPLGMFSGDNQSKAKKNDGQTDDVSTEDTSDRQAQEEGKSKAKDAPLSSAMIGTIGVYKNFISPLLPPACRFVPTCSQYGVQAIKEFGPGKGVVLTSWRILRCSPFGGKGYDPPKWPPVPYTYSSY